jgi:hypothetical protein
VDCQAPEVDYEDGQGERDTGTPEYVGDVQGPKGVLGIGDHRGDDRAGCEG